MEGWRAVRILIADDESEIRNIIRILLASRGYDVAEAKNGFEAVKIIKEDPSIELCIMDIMMPFMSGVDATAKIREFSNLPILFLTARSLEKDKEGAYRVGGDDYLVKPFSTRELLMKVEALTRRYNTYGAKVKRTEEIELPFGVVINTERHDVSKNGEKIDLGDKEYELLLYLARNPSRPIASDELYRGVWGEKPLSTSGNTVTVHILNLRRKLEEDPSSPALIRTVWGKGYQIG